MLSQLKIIPVLIGLFVFSLTACEQKTASSKALVQVNKKYSQDTVLEGAVTNNHGAIKSGNIRATTLSGDIITESSLSGSNHYQLTIPANTPLPMVLNFYPLAEDKENTEVLISVVIHPTITHYDISPLTTTIAKNAQRLGGYSHTNIVRAAEDTIHVPDANKTSTGFRGDPTTQYGGWH